MKKVDSLTQIFIPLRHVDIHKDNQKPKMLLKVECDI